MRVRYLAFIPDAGSDFGRWPASLAQLSRKNGWTFIDRPRAIVVTARPPLVETGDGEGLIIGQVIRRGERTPVAAWPPRDCDGSAPLGDTLARHYWGAHIALYRNGRDILMQRAPMGDLACYYLRSDAGTLVASDPLLLREAGGQSLRPDWDALAQHLIARGISRPRTCLASLVELVPGSRLTFGKMTVEPFWSPWDYVAPDAPAGDLEATAAQLQQTICDAIAADTASSSKSVLLLSGGLDSSIVAASLRHANRDVVALNMVTHAMGGDERAHARLVADHCDLPLTEVDRDATAVDIATSHCAALPYPLERSFRQSTLAAASALAKEVGADVIFDGGGGDNIFCSLQSAAPLSDLLRRRGPRWDALRLMRDIATIAQASQSAVIRQALLRLFHRSPAYRPLTDVTMLMPLARALDATARRHPWLIPPPGALSGKAGHIGLLVGAMSQVQSPCATTEISSRSILMTQPIVEACLAIPTWLWFDRGRNRAVARHAFGPLLPAASAWRQTKGAMDSFVVEIFEANRPVLRTMLADGWLAREGIIDREAVLTAIDAPGPVRGLAYARVLEFADVEAWVASWS